jgi:hypothetical protein
MSSLADLPELVGFFSYSREDDADSHGALSALRTRIQGELRGQLGRTARTFRLWQDKEAIPSGTLWETEIRNAVEQAVFFIPIITPTVIASPYCRFELDAFLAREAALGRSDLVFPILYIDVPALADGARRQNDAVLSLFAARQYADWRKLRHFDVRVTDVSEAAERFCTHIRDALHKPWVSPQERKEREAAEAERQRREAEAEQKRAEAERQRADNERVQKEAEARRRAEEERVRREDEARRRSTEKARHADKEGEPQPTIREHRPQADPSRAPIEEPPRITGESKAKSQAPPSGVSNVPKASVRKKRLLPVILVLGLLVVGGVAAGVVWSSAPQTLPSCDSEDAKEMLFDALKKDQLDPTDLTAVETVPGGGGAIFCDAAIQVSGKGRAAVYYSFHFEGGTPTIAYSLSYNN